MLLMLMMECESPGGLFFSHVLMNLSDRHPAIAHTPRPHAREQPALPPRVSHQAG
jgi:hypothetical protein